MHTAAITTLLISLVNAARLSRRDQTISASTRDPTANRQLGVANTLTTVNAGVYYWLSGRGTHNIYGNLNNSGVVTISQTDYLATASAGGQTCDFVGHTLAQGNLYTSVGSSISANDFGSNSAPTYDWYLRTFTNYGGIQFCGRGDTGGSTYQLYCDIDCYNYGIIDYGQYNGNLGASYVWRNAALYAPGATTVYNTYNYGTFRITNVVYHNVQNVLGNGCYVIGSGAVLYLEDGSGYYQNVNFGPTFPNQAIYFEAGGSGDLHMDTQVYSHNSNFGPQVYNYGAGNAIEFYEIFPTTNIFTYTASTGVLTVRFTSGNSVNIKIGTGYDATQFYTAKNPTFYNTAGYNAVFYRLAAPAQTLPSQCSASQIQKCGNPAATATAATSTSTTTSSTTTSPPTVVTTSTSPATTTSSFPTTTGPVTCTCPAPSSTVTVTATA